MATKNCGNGVYEVQERVDRGLLEKQLAWVAAQDGEEAAGVESLLSGLVDACDGRQDIHRKVIELEDFGAGEVLLFNPGAPSPFILASGYDGESKEWKSGSYFSRVEDAIAKAGERNVEDWNVCPECASRSIEGGFVEVGDALCTQKVWCNDCGARWLETYRQAERIPCDKEGEDNA